MEAVKDGLKPFLKGEYEITGVSVPSGVSDQPMSEAETMEGASNRVIKSIDLHPEFDYYVGLEGGVEETASGLMAFAWMVISNGQRIGKARTASFFLPPQVAELVHGGMELGHADDIVFAQQNSKQQNGAVGLLTNNVITRKLLYLPAVQMAFIPFLNPDLYP
jgi:inosine/xanthosine triphosphatase